MSATCSTCRFWGDGKEGTDWTADGVGFKRCMAVRERWKIQDEAVMDMPSRWEHDSDEAADAWDKARADALRAAKAYVQDGSEYRADLTTGPDFGCVLHQQST